MFYNLSFAGEIKKGFNAASVKKELIKHFNIPEDQINYLFSGQLITLKAKVTQSEALQHALEMDNIGAVIYISPGDAADTSAEARESRRRGNRRIGQRRRENDDNGLLSDKRKRTDRRVITDRRKK